MKISDVGPMNALVAYIEELERKAQECDDIKAANKRLAKYHADHL